MQGRNIYLIDDEPPRYKVLPDILEACNEFAKANVYRDGYEGKGVDAFENLEKLRTALDDPLGVVLLDLHLPTAQGGELVKRLFAAYQQRGTEARPAFESSWKHDFRNDAEFELGVCLAALAGALGRRAIVISRHGKELSMGLSARELVTKRFGYQCVGYPKAVTKQQRPQAYTELVRELALTIVEAEKADKSAKYATHVLKTKVTHQSDYRTITIAKQTFTLTAQQRVVVKLLFERLLSDFPGHVETEEIKQALTEAKFGATVERTDWKLYETFKSSPDGKQLWIAYVAHESQPKGRYYLRLD